MIITEKCRKNSKLFIITIFIMLIILCTAVITRVVVSDAMQTNVEGTYQSIGDNHGQDLIQMNYKSQQMMNFHYYKFIISLSAIALLLGLIFFLEYRKHLSKRDVDYNDYDEKKHVQTIASASRLI